MSLKAKYRSAYVQEYLQKVSEGKSITYHISSNCFRVILKSTPRKSKDGIYVSLYIPEVVSTTGYVKHHIPVLNINNGPQVQGNFIW